MNEKKTVDITSSMKRFARKMRLKEKYDGVKDWCCENPQLVVTIAASAVGLATTGIKAVSRHHNLRQQERIKEEYCYDPKLGHYWTLKRPLKNNEWLEIDRRRARGERMANILRSMKVLK